MVAPEGRGMHLLDNVCGGTCLRVTGRRRRIQTKKGTFRFFGKGFQRSVSCARDAMLLLHTLSFVCHSGIPVARSRTLK